MKLNPQNELGRGLVRPLLLHSVLQYGVDLLQPHRQANLGDVLVPPTVLVRKLDVGPERGVPAIQRAVLDRSEEHTSELQSRENLVCRLLLEKKNDTTLITH